MTQPEKNRFLTPISNAPRKIEKGKEKLKTRQRDIARLVKRELLKFKFQSCFDLRHNSSLQISVTQNVFADFTETFVQWLCNTRLLENPACVNMQQVMPTERSKQKQSDTHAHFSLLFRYFSASCASSSTTFSGRITSVLLILFEAKIDNRVLFAPPYNLFVYSNAAPLSWRLAEVGLEPNKKERPRNRSTLLEDSEKIQ